MHNQNSKPDHKTLKEIIARVADTLLPSKIDEIASALNANMDIVRGLVDLMHEGKNVREIYQLLIRLDVPDIAPVLETLLDSPAENVRHYAMLTLSDMPTATKSLKLKQALYDWLRQIPTPPNDEHDAITTMKAVKRLINITPIEPDVCTRLQSILFYIPRGAYREIYWPKTWVEASRQLSKLGCIEELKEVSCSSKTHYLSAAGAIALANKGFINSNVNTWLKNTRDYYLLDADERQKLEHYLMKIGDSEKELSLLRHK